MKRVSKSLLTLIPSLLMNFAAFAIISPNPGTYQVDPAHSRVSFEVPHLVISTVEGKFTKFDGSIQIATPFDKSKIDARVHISSVDTGEKDRDSHLLGSDFFDAAKYPEMSFTSTKIQGTPESFKLSGNLTLKGVTRPVVFDAKYLGTVKDQKGVNKSAFLATTQIDRRDFGLVWSKMVEAGPLVGDKVTISLRIESGEEKPAETKS
jgi:polyisoprenoid-binding protein YceI